jgi:hypothetical protein
VAQRIWQKEKLHCAAVGPNLDEDEIARALG